MHDLFKRLLDDFRGAWRFRRYALAAAWAVCLACWTIVFMMPDEYNASARVFVDTRTALASYIKDLAIQQDVSAQINFVRQSLLSRPALEKVIRETDLDLRAKTPQARASMVDLLLKEISVTASDAGTGGLVFTLSYNDRDRATSLRVVEMLMNTFVEDVLGGKQSGSQVGQKFLREQIEEYETKLREAEARLADFKRRNVGLMPGAQGDYFSRLQNELSNIEKSKADLSIAQSGREELQRQLRGEATSAAHSTSGSAATSETAMRIQEAQAKLDNLLLQYTDKHPDVIALRQTIVQLEERRKTELAAMRGGGGLPAGASANPVVQSIQLSINRADVEIAALRTRIGEGERNVAELKKLVDTAPEVEAEFTRLNRDYDGMRERYAAFVDRAERAKIGDQAEETDAVRFEVLDPPAAKMEPVAPNRPLLQIGGLLFGLACGAGLAVLLHQLRPVFTSSRVLSEVTHLPVLGVVSETWLDKHRSSRRAELIRYSIAAGALLVVFAFILRFSGSVIRMVQ
ncbi:MAG TPA: XrtA system polysaccharide chain length determinant [Steroidobacteraceae bacterium]|nr:XrtA system polysaccharide chain length determinant [Steroidobacteraceae bacterium]